MLLSLAITLLVVAWGFLVLAAIDFGSTARGGDSAAWGFLAIACLGAAACLFTGMILVGRLLRAAGIITDAAPPVDERDLVSVPAEPWPGEVPHGSASRANAAPSPVVSTPRRQGGKRAAR